MKKNILFCLLFLIVYQTNAQTYKYPRGIPPGVDSLYDTFSQKSPLTRSFYEGAPTSFSLKNYAPYPGNQGQYGTCTGWAVAYAARTMLEAQKNDWTDRTMITENSFSHHFSI